MPWNDNVCEKGGGTPPAAWAAKMNDQPKIAQEPAHDILRSERHPLDFIFRPRSVAVIGATDRQGSVGRTVIENLRPKSLPDELRHAIYPVNPQRTDVLGLPCYPAIGSIPGGVDLAVVVTPAATVPVSSANVWPLASREL